MQAQLEDKLSGGDSLRPVYLLGESFGVLLSLELARRCGNIVDRVVLVNPVSVMRHRVCVSVCMCVSVCVCYLEPPAA